MTEAEWFDCERPHAMLVFLRGATPAEIALADAWCYGSGGRLIPGPGKYISAENCRWFTYRCAERLKELYCDEQSREVFKAYRQYVHEGASWESFMAACKRADETQQVSLATVLNPMAGFWSDTPYGAAHAVNDIANAIASVKAKDSLAVLYASASTDDLANWGFSGPPDPQWEEAERVEKEVQASILRAVVGNPFPLMQAKEAVSLPDQPS